MPVVAQSLFWCPRAPALPLLLPHAYCRVFRLSRPPAPSPNRMSDTAVKLDSRSSARMCTAISGKQAMVFRLVPRTTWSWLYATPRGNRAATLASGPIALHWLQVPERVCELQTYGASLDRTPDGRVGQGTSAATKPTAAACRWSHRHLPHVPRARRHPGGRWHREVGRGDQQFLENSVTGRRCGRVDAGQ